MVLSPIDLFLKSNKLYPGMKPLSLTLGEIVPMERKSSLLMSMLFIVRLVVFIILLAARVKCRLSFRNLVGLGVW